MFKKYIDPSTLLDILCFKVSGKHNYFLMKRNTKRLFRCPIKHQFTILRKKNNSISIQQLAFKYRPGITGIQKQERKSFIKERANCFIPLHILKLFWFRSLGIEVCFELWGLGFLPLFHLFLLSPQLVNASSSHMLCSFSSKLYLCSYGGGSPHQC